MEAEVKQSQFLYEAWAWAETNWRRLAGGAAVVALVAVVVSFIVWRQGARATEASQALSALRPTAGEGGMPVMPKPEAYLKVAKDYAGTVAAGRATLLAAGAYFDAGKYAEAKAEFDRFLSEAGQSPLRNEALYGQAACLDAQGNKAAEAIAAFKTFVERFPSDPLTPRAKVSLARLYKTQNQPQEALRLLEEVSRTEQFGTVGLMAETLTTEIKTANPSLTTRSTTVTNALKVTPTVSNAPAAKAK